ncbi:MAG: hypothetical protein SVX43_23570 [Cyanobacteriota bacterium]|nr:hypothetical protein [Cyanobacteriota bacterium]
MGIKTTKVRGIRPTRTYRDGDYGNARTRQKDDERSAAISRRKLPPLPPSPPYQEGIDVTGCKLVCRLIKRNWDCYTSMPRHRMYQFRVPKFGGRNCTLLYRDNQWKLLRFRRKK